MSNKKSDAVEQQHEMIGVKEQKKNCFEYSTHPDAQWFKNGGNIGMFLHYGLSSVNGCIDLSWGMIANKPYETELGVEYRITPRKYWDMAKEFKPVNFAASMDRLMKSLKESGFTYAVLTTRHHEGFALWPSQYGDFNIGKYQPGMDLVKDFVEACRKYGIKTGFYYSPPDWHYMRDYMSFNYGRFTDLLYNIDHEKVDSIPEPSEEFKKGYHEYIRGQLKELLTNYGKIDILWFDGSCEYPYDVTTPEEIRSLQPGIIFNNRLFGVGDFKTPEVKFPQEKPEGPWEYCMLWPDGPWWSFMYQSKNFRSVEWLLDTYNKCKNWNGNFLVNVGPMADGSMPELTYTKLEEYKELIGK